MKNIKWILFIAKRFGSVDAKGKAAWAGLLSVLGIAFGTAALIVILSVMNGLQGGNIDSIMEVSSSHIRVTGSPEDLEKIEKLDGVKSLYVFTENQALMAGRDGRQSSVLIRAVPPDLLSKDTGLASKLEISNGSFDLSSPDSIILGYELADKLRTTVGRKVSLLAVSGSKTSDIFPGNAEFNVAGIFYTGYYDIDSSFAFVSSSAGEKIFGSGKKDGKFLAAVKLVNPDKDIQFILEARAVAPDAGIESWRSYNRAFFGALKVEKNALLLLSALIFIVVTVNIYNSMRRSIYEHREDICVLSAAGAKPGEIRGVFIVNGLGTGFAGAVLGVLCGLCISVRIKDVFAGVEHFVTSVGIFIASFAGQENPPDFKLFDPRYFYIDQITARIFFHEVLFVFVFGVFSAAAAAYFAGRKVTALKPGEILRYE